MIPTNAAGHMKLISLEDWNESTSWENVFTASDVRRPKEQWTALPADAFTDQAHWSCDGLISNEEELEEYDSLDSSPAGHIVVNLMEGTVELVNPNNAPAWWPLVTVRPVDKLTVWAGVRGLSRVQACKALGVMEDVRAWDWFWTFDGLELIRDYADFSAFGLRWALLGPALTWVAAHIRPEATLGKKRGGRFRQSPLNLYTCFVGKSGNGKGTVFDLAEEIVHAPGSLAAKLVLTTPEGLERSLQSPEADTDNKDATDSAKPGSRAVSSPAERLNSPVAPQVVVRLDELADLVDDHQGGKMKVWTTLTRGWSGEDLSATLADVARSRVVPAMSYRLCATFASQPKYAAKLMALTDVGMAQRVLFMPAVGLGAAKLPSKRVSTGEQLAVSVAVQEHKGEIPVSDQVSALLASKVVGKAVTIEEALTVSEEDGNAHRDQAQLRVAAVLNVIVFGTLEVTPTSWELAGAVLDVSELTLWINTKQVSIEARKEQVTKQLERMETIDEAEQEIVSKVSNKVLQQLKQGPAQYGDIHRKLSAKQRDRLKDALSSLLDSDRVKVVQEELPPAAGDKPTPPRKPRLFYQLVR